MTTRRHFLEASGTLLAAATLGACAAGNERRLPWATSDETPLAPPTGTTPDAISHVIARLSFGARPGEHARVRALAPAVDDAVALYIDEHLAPYRFDDRADRAVRRLEAMAEPLGELYEYQPTLLRDQLASATLLRAVHADRQLQEVMTGFWSDHFNVDISKGDCRWLTPAFARDVLRPHALGRFRELLRAVALSPAMLWYLDGRINRRGAPTERPNENYARELLELHTLGVQGGYTQADVMEVARALTGWTVRSRHTSNFRIGRVEFDASTHDDGPKMILGREIAAGRGARDVDDVLAIVTAHPACSRFIAAKLCRRFISDDPPSSAVDAVASTFARTDGDIPAVLRTLFATDAFRNARSTRFKRPFHFVVSALRATNATTDGGPPLLAWLERLGELPFQYPTPDGYPDDAGPWLGTLMWRWQFAAALTAGRIEGTRVDAEGLVRRAGGDAALMAHLFGRIATDRELATARSTGNALTLTLASPAFQLT